MRISSLLQEYSSKVIYQSMDFIYENVVWWEKIITWTRWLVKIQIDKKEAILPKIEICL